MKTDHYNVNVLLSMLRNATLEKRQNEHGNFIFENHI